MRSGRPLVLIHGQAHDRGAWLLAWHFLRRAGVGPIHLVCHRSRDVNKQLRQKLEELRAQYGEFECDLVGHSLGAIAAADYICSEGQVPGVRVRRVISLAGRLGQLPLSSRKAELCTLAAEWDWLVPQDSVLVGDQQATVARTSHLSILFSRRTWRQVVEWLA